VREVYVKKRTKWIIAAVIAVLLLLAVGSVVRKGRKNAGKEEIVRLEEVKRGQLIERISAPGEIEPKTTVQISAKVSARIIDMPYDKGDVITSGGRSGPLALASNGLTGRPPIWIWRCSATRRPLKKY
jgi:multidrug efflux pump subunit AcrA (membrane-fusion protein)